ncbi:MAG: hypothetical protein R3F11_28060 [Verrucomicrobiales bacterium]
MSYDLNYRLSLWKSIGIREKAQAVNREIANYVDVMIGNEEDFTACLGFEVEGMDEHLTNIETESFKGMIRNAVAAYPNFKVTATTLRTVKTATINDWGAICWHGGDSTKPAPREPRNHGPRRRRDSFASGLICGFLKFNDPQQPSNTAPPTSPTP